MAGMTNIDPKRTTVSIVVVVAIVVAASIGTVRWIGVENRIDGAYSLVDTKFNTVNGRIDNGFTRMAQIENEAGEISDDVEGIDDSLEETERAILLLKTDVRGLANQVERLQTEQRASTREILEAIDDLPLPGGSTDYNSVQ